MWPALGQIIDLSDVSCLKNGHWDLTQVSTKRRQDQFVLAYQYVQARITGLALETYY